MIVYELCSAKSHDKEYGSYTAYGIAVLYEGTVIRTVEDVSAEKEKVTALVKLFNEERLSPAHLDEAIENFLYDFTV